MSADGGRLLRWVDRMRGLHLRMPWLLPLLSFSLGWFGFFLFQRGESLARAVALIALLGWPWLIAENMLGRILVQRSGGRLSINAVRFVTQQIQQEILFFALPFLIGATQLHPGHLIFSATAVVVAIVITIDPIYLRRIASHRGLSTVLHGYCTFIASLVVLPVALHMPLGKALPLSVAITALTLLAGLPRMLLSVEGWRRRVFGTLVLFFGFALLWNCIQWIPAAGFWVRDARTSTQIVGLQPGKAVKQFDLASLNANGVVAFVAVRAPTGLSQDVVFEWRHRSKVTDRISAEISGGRQEGFRTYSRKRKFPADPRGRWWVDLKTPQGQVIARLRFTVTD